MSDITEYEFDAETFAAAWLSVCTAASEDDERPILYRTVAIELWEKGVRLTSTDSYLLWTAWVPSIGTHAHEAPTVGELPERVITAFDEDFRGRDLLKFAWKIVTAKDAAPQHLKMTLGPAPLEDGQFPGTERDAVSLSFPADVAIGERVVLATIDFLYPEWRSLIAGKTTARVETVALMPVIMGRLSLIKRYWQVPLRFTFTGGVGVILLDPILDGQARPGGPTLMGGVMPIRTTEGEAA